MDRILVGVDGSQASTNAAAWAAGEAAMHNSELTIVHVLAASSDASIHTEWPVELFANDVTNAAVAQGQKIIGDALAVVTKGLTSRQRLRIASRLCWGPVIETLWAFTQEGARMIVLGRRRRSETHRARLDSVAGRMLQTARCPVTVVPHDRVSRLQENRAPVVVGVNSSPACGLAIAVAFDEAARRSVELVAVHAIDRAAASPDTHAHADAMHRHAECALAYWQVRYRDVTVRQLIVLDDPLSALLNQSRHAQLVVVGGSRSGSFVAESFGGISSALTQACRIPVTVARRKPATANPELTGALRTLDV